MPITFKRMNIHIELNMGFLRLLSYEKISEPLQKLPQCNKLVKFWEQGHRKASDRHLRK